tara:strand:+ start:260 stop:505 length:246 start_codon:yes stop_codon:yes gene_type:complete
MPPPPPPLYSNNTDLLSSIYSSNSIYSIYSNRDSRSPYWQRRQKVSIQRSPNRQRRQQHWYRHNSNHNSNQTSPLQGSVLL